jgi:magnesium transporter
VRFNVKKGGYCMIKIYNTDIATNETSEINEIKNGCWINLVSPTENEIKKVCKSVKMKEDFIRYSLDYEEKARIDIEDEDNTILFIIDVPIMDKENNETIHSTIPLGIIVVRDDYFLTVSLKQTRVISDLKQSNIITYKKSRSILQIFYKNSELFLKELKKINREKEVTEKELNTSMKNKELLKMLSIEKSLVYITTSLKSNELVMEKTMKGKIIKLYDEDEDILEDAIIENRQAIEMAKIYSDILSGTMDAYASIISNNLNIVMKFLTLVTIALSIPTLFFSMWGMNVNVPFQNNPYGFVIIVVMSIVVTLAIMWWFKKNDILD